MIFSRGIKHICQLSKYANALSFFGALVLSQGASATIVQFQTVLGDFEVNLFDKTTPKTVENFLTYVKANAYANTIVHRTVPGALIQGGGYTADEKIPFVSVKQNAAVTNEPVYSNLRGTIALAKRNDQPNSATNQWFINLTDKNATDKAHGYTLDTNNGGFAVFGQVMGNGMQVVDAIAALSRFNIGLGFENLPLRNYSASDAFANKPITDDHFMLIENVVILNADPDTAASLTPVKNTSLKRDGGGGTTGLTAFALLALLALSRKSLLNRK